MKRAFPGERPFRKSLNHGMRWWLAAWEALQREAQPDRLRRSQNRFANENVFSDSSAEKSGKSTCKTKATNFPNWRQKYFSPNLRRKGEHFGIETNWSFPNSIIEADFFPIWNKNVYNKSQHDSFRTIARFVTGTNLAKLQQMETETIFAPRASQTCL